MPYGISCGASVNSTPRARSSSYVAWQSSVVRNTVPAKPIATTSITCFLVTSSITGSPGTAISTIDTSSWPGGPIVSQRKVSSKSGNETSWRTSIPTFSVQYFSATSWSWTHKWALAIFIMGTTLRSVPAARLLPMCCLANPGVGGRTGVAFEDATRYPGVYRCRRHVGAVGGRRQPVHPGEARGEGPDALQADHHADIGHRPVGLAQQRCRTLEAPCLQIRARGLAERPGEHPAEMGPRQSGGRGQIVDRDGLGVAGVDQIFGPQQITGGRHLRHALSLFGG